MLVANGDVPVTRRQCGDRDGGEVGDSLGMRKAEVSKDLGAKIAGAFGLGIDYIKRLGHEKKSLIITSEGNSGRVQLPFKQRPGLIRRAKEAWH